MVSLELRAIAWALGAAGIAAGVLWLEHRGEAMANAKASVRAAEWAASTAVAQRRQDAQQQENRNETNRFNARREADLHVLDADLGRVRQHLAAGGGLGTVPAAAPSGSSAPVVPASGVVSADVYWRAVQAARDLSNAVDCLRGVSDLCAKNYGALTP